MRILLVEDEVELSRALSTVLVQNQMVVDIALSLRQAFDLALSAEHDVIILDRGLPDGDGLALVEVLKKHSVPAAILVLTAKSEIFERVHSLDVGADDYLAKPFAMDELMARIRALHRRPVAKKQLNLMLGNLCFVFNTRHVSVSGEPLILPRRELLVLETLLQCKGRTVERRFLQERVYGTAEDIQSNALDTHISRLRTKLLNAHSMVEIHAVRGVGYLLDVIK